MLVIFDADGTLADRDSGDIYPWVWRWFNRRFVRARVAAGVLRFAIATNQGGVGLRYWMESGGWGNPAGLPTPQSAARRYYRLAHRLGIPRERVYIAYRYRSRKGVWSPVPPNPAYPERWRADWRKPAPGMLIQAMTDAQVSPANTIFVGDREEDRLAAQAAGVRFHWARDFFGMG